MPIIFFNQGDKLILKKKHPCGCNIFTVVRAGSDVRMLCDGCSRDITVDREKAEKMIKKVLPQDTATT